MHEAFIAVLLIVGIIIVGFVIAMFAAIFTVTGEISEEEEQRYIRYMLADCAEDKKEQTKPATKQEEVEDNYGSEQTN